MATQLNPYMSHNFLIEIDGIVQAGFSECSGLGSAIEMTEYREGGDTKTVRKLRGKVSYPDITLKWGVTTSRELYDWHLAALEGNVQRKNGSVIVLDDLGTEKVRWNFFGGVAMKWDAPSLNASGSDVAVDTLTISVQRVERA